MFRRAPCILNDICHIFPRAGGGEGPLSNTQCTSSGRNGLLAESILCPFSTPPLKAMYRAVRQSSGNQGTDSHSSYILWISYGFKDQKPVAISHPASGNAISMTLHRL